MVTVGLAIVVLDFRLGALDLAFDPFGWALVALAARKLLLGTTLWAACLAAVLSVSDAVLPFHYDYLDPVTGERVDPRTGIELGYPEHLAFDPASGFRLAVMALAVATAGVTLWLLLGGLAHMAQTAGEVRTANQLRGLRWLVLGLWAAPYLAVIATAVATDGSFDPVWNGELEYAVFVGVLPFALLAVLLLHESGNAWTFPAGTVHRSPWAERRSQRNARPPQP
jgi:hypothetical protein